MSLLAVVAGTASGQTIPAGGVRNILTNAPTGSPGNTIEVTVDGPPAGNYADQPTLLNNTFIRLLNADNSVRADIPIVGASADDDSAPSQVFYQFVVPSGLAPSGANVTYKVQVRAQSPAAVFTTPINDSRVFTALEEARITGVSPSTIARGATQTVTITGDETVWTVQSVPSFSGASITVGSVNLVNATTLTAQVQVAAGAAVGPRNVTVTTPGSSQTLANALTITYAPGEISIAPSPTGAVKGRSLTLNITGTNTSFTQGVTTVAFSGAGITAGAVTVNSATLIECADHDRCGSGHRRSDVDCPDWRRDLDLHLHRSGNHDFC